MMCGEAKEKEKPFFLNMTFPAEVDEKTKNLIELIDRTALMKKDIRFIQ